MYAVDADRARMLRGLMLMRRIPMRRMSPDSRGDRCDGYESLVGHVYGCVHVHAPAEEDEGQKDGAA